MERDFQDVLTDLDEGKVHAQLTEKLPEIVRAVMATGKAGALSLTLSVTRENRMVVVKADVKTKTPQPATESTLFYTSEDGVLRRDDPKQPALRGVPLRPPTAELKTVTAKVEE